MRQNGYQPDAATAIAQYFDKAALPTQQETLGQVVVEILRDGRSLNRKTLCRLEDASDLEEEKHYQTLIGLLFDR